MDALKTLPTTEDAVYAALGNAVNVRVVRLVAEALIGESAPTIPAQAA
jgi:site-specific DNA-cytosine methylase